MYTCVSLCKRVCARMCARACVRACDGARVSVSARKYKYVRSRVTDDNTGDVDALRCVLRDGCPWSGARWTRPSSSTPSTR